MDWRRMGTGPGGKGTLWMAEVVGGYLWMFIPGDGGPKCLTFASMG